MDNPTDKELAGLFIQFMTQSFNRSLEALRRAGAINTDKLRTEYRGVGSKYYDIVTEQMELTTKLAVPALRNLLANRTNDSKPDSP